MDELIEIRDLRVWFPIRKGVFSRTTGYVKAVDGVSFALRRGETLGVVGESGSGKSTLARVIAGLQKPTGGEVRLGGRIGMVFQDPLGSLNPRMTVRSTLDEASRGGESAAWLLETVGLDASALDKYPHEFSGGQRQRICIARAIAVRPDVLICDEAVSALDLQIRSQILDLLSDLKSRLGLSLLFITHDLGVVQHIADRLIVMHRGKVVEEGDCERVLREPCADYTRSLIDAVPSIGVPLGGVA
ncbi:MAG: ABC transporter ATP-binding protein [Kiritimatiellae bacterium]|nr:ABC transporter ATP-binding protein [Kiritimatiellia bacterium]